MKISNLYFLIKNIGRELRLAFFLMKDARVPFIYKIPLFLAILYFIFPADLFSDYFVPGLGYIDDLVILIWAIRFLNRWSPAEIKQEYYRKY